jgi:hypothetical protein
MRHPDPSARFLPPGLPLPEREAMAALRQSILAETATKHPPEAAELAVLIVADEAGIDLSGVDAAAVWASPPEAREPIFVRLGELLGDLTG